MSLPFDLATSTTFNIMSVIQHPLNPLDLLRERPNTLSPLKGSVYTAPGFDHKDGFKFYTYGNEIHCMVRAKLNGFDRPAFDKAVKAIRDSINAEYGRVDATYNNQPFKRLIGLSYIHHYRMAKREMESYIRSVLGLNDNETISYKTPTSVASSITKPMLTKVEQLPIPVAVIRNHKIDGHIYLQLPMRGFTNNQCIPVAVVSELNKKTIASIQTMVSDRKWGVKEDADYWLTQLDNVVKSIEHLETSNV